jgi:glycerol-3-phosphate dehydrogenase
MAARLRAWGIEHRFCGKLIVAADDVEVPDLELLRANADASGQTACRLVDRAEARRIEPNVRGVAALFSPETGIFDVPGYLTALAAHATDAGATLLASTPAVAIETDGAAVRVVTATRGTVRAAAVVNAAGLYADEVARRAGNDRYRVHPCRGEYASVLPRSAGIVRGLIYPVPRERASLGVHLTRTVAGDLWIGPTVRYVARKDDYEADRLPLETFHERSSRLIEGLDFADLRLGPSGIRPKRVPEGSPAVDFLIERDPSVPGLIHLVGIESPGLTASPAIAAHVLGMIEG